MPFLNSSQYYRSDNYVWDGVTPVYNPVTSPLVLLDVETDEASTYRLHCTGVYLTPVDPTWAWELSRVPEAGDNLSLCGARVDMDPAWVANLSGQVYSQQPNGPMTFMFYDSNGNQVGSTRTELQLLYSDTFLWAFPAEPKEDAAHLLVSALAKDGSVLDGPYPWYPSGGDLFNPYTARTHYGLKIEHKYPGTNGPASFGVSGIGLELQSASLTEEPCTNPSPKKQLVGGFGNGYYVTTTPTDDNHVKISLVKAIAGSKPKTADTKIIDAYFVLDHDQSDDTIVLCTTQDTEWGFPINFHTIRKTKNNKLSITTNAAPEYQASYTSGGVVYYYTRSYYSDWFEYSWCHKRLFVSADSKHIAVYVYSLEPDGPNTYVMAIHDIDTFQLLHEINVTESGWEEFGYPIGFPREGRFLWMYKKWYGDQWSDIVYFRNRQQIRLLDYSGNIIDSMYFYDPFGTISYNMEKWATHADGSLTYVRTLPEEIMPDIVWPN